MLRAVELALSVWKGTNLDHITITSIFGSQKDWVKSFNMGNE